MNNEGSDEANVSDWWWRHDTGNLSVANLEDGQEISARSRKQTYSSEERSWNLDEVKVFYLIVGALLLVAVILAASAIETRSSSQK